MSVAGTIALFKAGWKPALGLVIGAALCWPVASCDGARRERDAWALKAAEVARKAIEVQRTADAALRARQTADETTITRNRQEVDHAVRDIPDQATSARQRARACVELRRQGLTPAQLDAAGCAADAR